MKLSIKTKEKKMKSRINFNDFFKDPRDNDLKNLKKELNEEYEKIKTLVEETFQICPCDVSDIPIDIKVQTAAATQILCSSDNKSILFKDAHFSEKQLLALKVLLSNAIIFALKDLLDTKQIAMINKEKTDSILLMARFFEGCLFKMFFQK
jgi:hypothetical protein